VPEAPPWSPGHVGHTPQHVGEMLRASRLQGILTANVPRYRLRYPKVLSMATLPQLQRGIRGRGPFSTLLGIEDYKRRVAGAGASHFPGAYREGMNDPRFTVAPKEDRG
jgi:hypothetical protein